MSLSVLPQRLERLWGYEKQQDRHEFCTAHEEIDMKHLKDDQQSPGVVTPPPVGDTIRATGTHCDNM